MEYVSSCDRTALFCDSILKHDLHSFAETQMNAAIFLGPAYHASFKANTPHIHSKTTISFPIYNCEFMGNESANEVMLMRRDFVSTVDWNRKPYPKIYLRFDNPKTKGGTIGTKLGLAKLDTVEREVQDLSGVKAGFIDVLNFRNIFARIVSPKRNFYYIYDNNENLMFSGELQSTLSTLKTFLIEGNCPTQ
jgi:hypothetical protein